MPDSLDAYSEGITAPAKYAASVTPSDSAELSHWARALYIGGAGDVYLDTVGGSENVGFIGLAAGTILDVRTKKVMSTSTTATSIVALW